MKNSSKIINVRVRPNSSRRLIEQKDGYFKVYVNKPAQDGRANQQLIKLLAEYMGVKKYQVRIVKGQNCRDKLIEIDGCGTGLRE
jgi:uncharacterized protein (TIGR00251 family)